MKAAGLWGGEELDGRGNQPSLIPHGQEDVAVLLAQAARKRGHGGVRGILCLLFTLPDLLGVVLAPYWLLPVRRTRRDRQRRSSVLVSAQVQLTAIQKQRSSYVSIVVVLKYHWTEP